MSNHNICCHGCYKLGKQEGRKEAIEDVEKVIQNWYNQKLTEDIKQLNNIKAILSEVSE